jgi:hypothetical protein
MSSSFSLPHSRFITRLGSSLEAGSLRRESGRGASELPMSASMRKVRVGVGKKGECPKPTC